MDCRVMHWYSVHFLSFVCIEVHYAFFIRRKPRHKTLTENEQLWGRFSARLTLPSIPSFLNLKILIQCIQNEELIKQGWTIFNQRLFPFSLIPQRQLLFLLSFTIPIPSSLDICTFNIGHLDKWSPGHGNLRALHDISIIMSGF